jgi:hypothetical protein
MTADVKMMERTRDLQAEVGATCDRFHESGLPAFAILDAVSAEVSIWLARTNRQLAAEAAGINLNEAVKL